MIECPCCGAREVLGVWLPKVKARIVQAALRAGDHGVEPADFDMTPHNFKAHNYQINNLYLSETDWRLRGRSPRGVYRLVEEK